MFPVLPRLLGGLLIVGLLTGCTPKPPVPRETPAAVRSPFAEADALYRAAKYEEAARHYAALRQKYAAARDLHNEWRARLWWVRSLHIVGRNKEGAAELEPLMQMAEGHPLREGWTRCTIALLHARAARYTDSLVEGRRGLELANQLTDPALTTACYDAVVTALSNSGQYRESLALSQQRILLERSRRASPPELADALNDLGVDYRHVGRFEDAIKVYEEALGLYRKIENPEGTAKVLYNLGNIYAALGDGERTIQLKQESLRYAEQMNHAWGLGTLHSDLAAIFLERELFPEARTHLNAALSIAREADLPYIEADALRNLAWLELQRGDFAQARFAAREGIALADAKKVGHSRVRLRSVAAENEAAAGQYDKAIRWADEAVALARDLNDPEIEFESLQARAVALERAGDPRSYQAYLAAIDLLESVRGRLALGDLRIGVAERRLGIYEGAIRVLLRQDRPEEAFEVAERAKARVLLALISEQEARSSTRTAEAELRQRLREAYEARRSARGESLRRQIDERISGWTAELSALETAQTHERLENPLPASLDEIRGGLVRPGTALIAYFWGDNEVYGWCLSANETRGKPLGDTDSLTSIADLTRAALQERSDGWQVPARRAYQRFIEPLIPASQARLLIIPDGPLAYLPAEVLIPRGSRLPLGATTEIVYGPSATVLLELSRHRAPREFSRTVLAVGNPLPKEQMLAGFFNRNEERPSLPYAVREVKWIANLFDRSDFVTGEEATIQRWLESRPENYRYLHFATHAQVDDRRAARASLTMADGELDVPRIRQLSLQTELVTLSACETALGRRIRGEGIIGLPHAFLSAGARGVVVTLWRVPDKSTAQFVRDFYREIHDGSAPARALLTVRRRWVEREPAASPHEWAPFILVGGLSPRA